MMHDPFTLVIALNSSQEAEGELYLDDGKSFDFKQGAYIHRCLVFSSGHLTSSNAASSSLGNSRFSSDCIIERIILLGHAPGAKTALIEPGNQKAEIRPGPLRFGEHVGAAVTIRKPGARVAEDWKIKVL
ncbi:hypothetical protein F3Y22_tig00112530pilonHSYRG00247 [Hibiscus syriacus]|uniref:Uncharacterized protein n=1 Tax=Hibiscus syriacus TaxID=106335 RepID=A0A6A2WWN1_HIBSY|nr:hypothetical protein F3Y22_tig00112530pilonHSYRG00247 [Hibiscus syriacus]